MKSLSNTSVQNTEGMRFTQSSAPAAYYERHFEIAGTKFSRRASTMTPMDRGRWLTGEDRNLTPATFDAWCERLNHNLVRTLSAMRD
jgi:hypothetical protein